jgi:type VI secretion system secreted protein Hcp
MADVRYFLRLGDIPGDSTDARHAREIELLSFAWGLHSAGGARFGGGAGAGKVEVDGVTCVARTGSASPLIFLACARGEHIPEAVITGQRVGAEPFDALTITMADAVVISYSIGGGVGDGPEDEVMLSFSRIEMEDTDGTTSVKAGWDVVRNAPI